MLDNEFIILVVDGDGAEAPHGALARQSYQECFDVFHVRESYGMVLVLFVNNGHNESN